MLRLLALLVAVAASQASAQALLPEEAAPDSARADTVGTVGPPAATPSPPRAVFPYGRSLTYREILTEARSLRRLPEPPLDSAAGVDPVLGVTGLIVDETVSPPGRLFYETFFLAWTPPPGAERVTVTVGEQPLPGNGTAVVIRTDGEIVVQTRLPRRAEEVEDLAGQAVAFVRRRLAGG